MPWNRTLVFPVVSALAACLACGGGGGGGDTPGPVQKVAVTSTAAGTGTGTVTSTPAGIQCGATCSAEFDGGSTVTFSAAAGDGSKFVGWSGACKGVRNPCTVALSAAGTVTASFSKGGSGLPAPGGGGVAKPGGAAGNLQVLDWAGFRAAISYSFDDAFPSQVYGDNYAMLHATGVPLTYYVVPSQVALHLDAWKQVLADGNELGNHTLNHCNVSTAGKLSGCLYGGTPAADATPASQIDDTTSYIVDTLGASGVWTIASPYGDTNWAAPVQQAHMLINRDVDYTGTHAKIPPRDLTNQYHVPSILFGDQYGGLGHTAAAIDGRIDAARTDRVWSVFLFHSLSPVATADVSKCCEVPAENVAASLDYLNSLGDVWGGTVVDVAAYWIGQVVVQQAQSVTADGVTTWTWTLPEGFPPGKYVRVTVDGGTLSQGGHPLVWDEHGYYEVALDAGELTLQ